VSRPDVYRVIKQLQEIGLIEKIVAKPEVFQVIPIEECVSLLLQKRIKKTRELQDQGLKLVQSMKKIGNPVTSQNPWTEFIIVPNKSTIYARSERMLRSLEESICLVGLTKSMVDWLLHYSPVMEATLSQGIDCRMILPDFVNEKIKSPFLKLQKYKSFKLKTISGNPKATFSIWDKKELLLTTSFAETQFPASTLWSNNRSLIELLIDYFECLWTKAEKI